MISSDYVGLKPTWKVRPDLIWDNEVRGLCLRVYGNGSKSFVFLYCIDGRQRFIRIGRSPQWSLKAARIRAKQLRSIIDQGRDPAGERREGGKMTPVGKFIRYIAEHPRYYEEWRIAANVAKLPELLRKPQSST